MSRGWKIVIALLTVGLLLQGAGACMQIYALGVRHGLEQRQAEETTP